MVGPSLSAHASGVRARTPLLSPIRSAVCAAVLLLAACSTSPQTSRVVLTPVDFGHLPGWRDDAMAQVLPAFARSCDKLADLPPGRPIGRDGQGGVAGDWLAPCGALRDVATGDDRAARAYFEAWFRPYLVAAGSNSEGLFTGYFEPQLNGSRRVGGRYRVPLYGRPADLQADPGRADHPYYSRAEIEAGALVGKAAVLFWVDDPVDAYILQVQGSGRILLDDGTRVQVGYDGSNGQRYVSLARILLNHGWLTPDDTTMQTVRAVLKAHPVEAPGLMRENPRYVFFRLVSGEGPVGTAGVALTAGRSLAVDPEFVPLGVPLWLDTSEPDGTPLRRLMVAQDSGAAIKGAVRGDVFWGAGEAAFDKAGRMNRRGSYYLLLPRQKSGMIALAAAGFQQ